MEASAEALGVVKLHAKELEGMLDELAEVLEIYKGTGNGWPQVLQLYSRAAAILKDLQDHIPITFAHYLLLPDFREHANKEQVPDLLNTQWQKQESRQQAMDTYRSDLAVYSDVELDGKVVHFNRVCREMQALFKPKS